MRRHQAPTAQHAIHRPAQAAAQGGRGGDGLVLSDISHAYDGKAVLRAISLAVAPGEIACLLGPSGCGKTTLLRIVAGLETPLKGRVVIGGSVMTDRKRGVLRPPEERGVGMVFQDYALFPHLNVLDNITFAANGGRAGQAAGRLWVRQAMARLDIGALAASWPHTLSGGQQQRVALLRALAAAPGVLLLDEPFSGLDAGGRTRVRQATLDLLRDSNVTILMVTHDHEEAMFMADRIFVLNDGAVVQAGTPGETWLGPANVTVTELFGPVNHLRGTVRRGVVETVVGRFAAAGLNDGVEVDVLIRPDGVGVAPRQAGFEGGVHGRVASARLLGRCSLLRLEVVKGGRSLVLDARIAGVILPRPGTQVAVLIEKCSVFVFPRRPRASAKAPPPARGSDARPDLKAAATGAS